MESTEVSRLYRTTIDDAYYVASFLMRDENLTVTVLKESYAQAGQYLHLIHDGADPVSMMNRIVSAQALEDLREKDPVSYRAFYAPESDLVNYARLDQLKAFAVKTDGSAGLAEYSRAAGRFVTALKLQPQPQSDAAFLYYYVKMSVPEIAAAMDLAENVVEKHLASSNRKMIHDAQQWAAQGRIPSDIDWIPFLVWALGRDRKRTRYDGPDIMEALQHEEIMPGKSREDEPVTLEPQDEEPYEREPRISPQQKKYIGIAAAIIIAAAVVILVLHGMNSSRNKETVSDTGETSESTEADSGSGRDASAGSSSSDFAEDKQSAESDPDDAKQPVADEPEGKDAAEAEPAGKEEPENKETEEQSSDLDPLENPAGFVFPDSDKEAITPDQVRKLDFQHYRIAMNEIYARAGRDYSGTSLEEYFKGKSWYHPTIAYDKFDESRDLNDVELKNINTLLKNAPKKPQ